LDPIEELLHIDWRETGIKLAGYAAFRARNLGWRTGSGAELAKGLMPDDIAAQAILSVVSGERKWDPERGPLLPYLKLIVDSLLSHLAESHDNRNIERLLPDDAHGPPEEQRKIWSEDDEIPASSATSLYGAEVDQDDTGARKIQRLIDAAQAKPELAEVLRAILDFDEARPRHIAVRIRKPVTHVNNCLKRLRRLALKISVVPEAGTVLRGAVSP